MSETTGIRPGKFYQDHFAPRIKYCLRYLADVAFGRHGWLTPRQIGGDVRSIWQATTPKPETRT